MMIAMKPAVLLMVFSLLGSAAWAQNGASASVPDAPSATLQQSKPAPAPAPQQSAPAQPGVQTPTASPQQSSSNSVPDVGTPDAAPAPQPSAATAAPTTDESSPVTTIKKTVDEINVIFTVTDKKGRFVKDLKKEDFAVLDDNKPVKDIRAFATQSNLPLRVGLLIDTSNSIRDRFSFEQEAAIEFLNQIVRPKYDRAFVLGFDTTHEIVQDFTDSTEKLARGIRTLRPGGGTALWDAVYFAARDRLMRAGNDSGTAVRRAIIVLSDGEDNQSRVTREEAIEMAQRAEVIIYAISTNVSGNKNRGDKYLERAAEATGGRAFFPFKIQDVADAFTGIQDELRSQYVLAYRPDNLVRDGRFRTIDIISQNRKNLRIRSRKGYYAEKEQ